MGAMAAQITSLTTVYIRAQVKVNIKAFASLAFVWGIHRGPVNSPHKWPVTRKMFPFDDVMMQMSRILYIIAHKICLLFYMVFPLQRKRRNLNNIFVVGTFHFENFWRITYHFPNFTWWRHQMETFSALLAICAGNSPASGEFPAQRPATRSFDVLVDLRMNERLSKHSWGWWLETPSCPLWRQSNEWCNRWSLKMNK